MSGFSLPGQGDVGIFHQEGLYCQSNKKYRQQEISANFWFAPANQQFIQIKGWTTKKIWYESLQLRDKQTSVRPVNGKVLIPSGLLQSMPWPNVDDLYFIFLQCDCHMRIEKVIADRLICIPKRTVVTKLCSLQHNLLSSVGLLVCTDGSWKTNDSSSLQRTTVYVRVQRQLSSMKTKKLSVVSLLTEHYVTLVNGHLLRNIWH
jgi:hypothetical protein